MTADDVASCEGKMAKILKGRLNDRAVGF